MPSSPAGCQEFTSRITLSARSSQVLLFPTDEDGIRPPSSVIPITSTTATSSRPKNPSQTIWATWDKWTSRYSISPALIFALVTGSDW